MTESVLKRGTLKKELKTLAWFLLASVVQSYLMCARCNTVRSYLIVFTFTFCMWILLWGGNSLLTSIITRKISWIDYPVKRFFVGLISTVLYTLASILILMTVFERIVGFNFGGGYYMTIYGSVIITVIISLFLHSREFLHYWRKATLDAEKYRRESIAAKYETLKTRVNPDLLFRSFHSLRSLVFTDKEKSIRFIKELSEVYRYILETREKEIVAFEDESKFLRSYFYLLRARVGTRLEIENTIEGNNFFIPPLAIQLLIESVVNSYRDQKTDERIKLKLEHKNGNVILSIQPGVRVHGGEFEEVVAGISSRLRFLTDSPIEVTGDEYECKISLPAITSIISPV